MINTREHMFKRKIWLITFLIFISACSKSCGKKNNLNIKSINLDISSSIDGLDPRYTTSAVSTRVGALVYASLFEIGADLTPRPLLAKEVKTIDKKTFVITLRDDLKFHDGSPLQAKDVVYTFSNLANDEVLSPHAQKFNYVESINAIDSLTVEFKLKNTYAPFLIDLCAIGIVSKSSCLDRSKECRHEYNGSGPYMVDSWDKAKEMLLLKPFTGWFEGEPKAYLRFRVVRDENTRMLEMIGKKADIIDSDICAKNAFELEKQKHLELIRVPGLGFRYLAMNVRGPGENDKKNSDSYKTKQALANPLVRKAIAQSIDFDQIINKLLMGTAKRVSGLIPNGHWAKDISLKPIEFDPASAQRILDEAGFVRNSGNNFRFKLSIVTTSNRISQSISQLYKDFLERVGIDVSIRVKDWSALYQDMKKGNFEMFSAIWVPVIDPDLYYFVHHSSSIPQGDMGGGNRHGYKNSEVDRLIELGRETLDMSKRKRIYQELERKLMVELPYIPMWNDDRLVLINSEKVAGFYPQPTGSFLGLRKAYIK